MTKKGNQKEEFDVSKSYLCLAATFLCKHSRFVAPQIKSNDKKLVLCFVSENTGSEFNFFDHQTFNRVKSEFIFSQKSNEFRSPNSLYAARRLSIELVRPPTMNLDV